MRRYVAITAAATLFLSACGSPPQDASLQSSTGGTVAAGGPARLRAPAGAVLELEATTAISSRHNHVGDPVGARLVRTLKTPTGDTILPAGAIVVGNVTSIAPAENPHDPGTLTIGFTGVRVEGHTYPIHAAISAMDTERQGRGVTAGDAGKVGVGAVAGGIAGRIIGGNRTGTLVGVAAGAAAGGVYAHETRDIDVVLPRGATIRITLTRPFERRVAAAG